MQWFVDRAKERSTWVGIVALLGMLGVQVDDGTIELVSQLVVAAAGLAAVFMREKKP